MADKIEIKAPADFILEAPLYFAIPCEFSDDSKDALLAIFYENLNFDGHCPSCKQKTTYFRKSEMFKRYRPNGHPPESLPHQGFMKTTVYCARDEDHRI